MKITSLLAFTAIFTIGYLLVMLASTFFLGNFGPQDDSLYGYIVRFFIFYPINPLWDTSGETALFLLVLNGAFWGVVSYFLSLGIRKILNRYKAT